MKKTTMVLALMAVVAMTSACFAEVTIELVKLPNPAPGLVAWNVHFNGTNAFENLIIAGEVHQANIARSGGRLFPTVWLSDFDLPNEAADAAVDTHFLYTEEGVAKDGADVVETNSWTNPASLPLGPDYEYGNGMFDATGMRFAVKGDLNPEGYDVIQVVLAMNDQGGITPVVLSGLYWEYGGDDPGYRSFSVTIPEPGTIALLIAGALGLLVARLRRK
ncbi:MAG: PEP-CTERM sorting domain-containing protein [Pirellulales bacterium]|nr:PEP-CTERM sorting domain-containing protein [Pirellulales bacterium]